MYPEVNLPASSPRIYVKRDQCLWLQTSIQRGINRLCWLSVHIPLAESPLPLAVVRCDDWINEEDISDVREWVEQCIFRVLCGSNLPQIKVVALNTERPGQATEFHGTSFTDTDSFEVINLAAEKFFELVDEELRKASIPAPDQTT